MDKKDAKHTSEPESEASGNPDSPTPSSDSHREDKANPGNDDATVIRDTPAHEDATVIRTSPPSEDETVLGGATASEDATALRDAQSHEDETIIREPPADQDATVIRDATPDEDATVIRNAPADQDATLLRDHVRDQEEASVPRDDTPANDDATLLRETPSNEDETVLNQSVDEDETVLADNQRESDSTYIAAVGTPTKRGPGSSDAGRLLKNRFVLEQKIGSGGMADVYKALDLRLQEQRERNPYVAIKLLKEEFAKHQDATVSLQREASKTRRMPHKNIMAVYDFDAEGDTVFMAMELLTGEPLDNYLKRHPEGLETDVAWNLVRGICEGLIMAHSKNIVHSDFKPGNIFFTDEKTAKILDFGIARAAANPNPAAGGDETVFDAGSLGALTPAYASYEMLTGQIPTKSDDVYAAALVAYEMFTGKHPYGRVPADQALEQGLEPERIPFLKRRHWQALLNGMAIKNEDRTQTMEEFMEGMFSEGIPILRYAAIAIVASAIIGYGAYTQLTEGPAPDPALLSAQTELGIRKDDLRELLADPAFTPQWETEIRELLDAINSENETLVKDFSEASDADLPGLESRVQQLYLEEVQRLRQQYEQGIDQADQERDPKELLGTAETYLDIVRSRYNFQPGNTETEVGSLKLALRNRDTARNAYAEKVAREKEIAAAEKRRRDAEARAIAEQQRQEDDYQERYAALEEQMKCKRSFKDKDGMAATVGYLQETHTERFAEARSSVVEAMRDCIIKNRIGNPKQAKVSKAAALAVFPGEKAISSIKIQARDPCGSRSLAGRGAHNKKCQDILQSGGKGPELVVIPRSSEMDKFAIGRTELKIGEYNAFCKQTGCDQVTGSNSLPVTNISVEQARAYLAWLSTESGRSYRLPKPVEWLLAARADMDEAVDVNVNCTVNSRGVRLGEKLVKTLSGKPNGWGLYHHVGNAREWTEDGDNLLAMGGAHTDQKKDCTHDRNIPHSGDQDAVTGFRVYRKI